jgi:hypothetical protein
MKETVNPQHALFKKAFIDPKSPTFGNVRGSLQKAGFSDSYSGNATALKPAWLYAIIGDVRRARMLDKAEEVLEDTLSMPAVDMEGKVDNALLKTKTDVGKFIAKTQGKDNGWSDRTEHTGADGAELKITFDNAFGGNETTS